MAAPAHIISRLQTGTRVPLLQVAKSALATALAWLIAAALLPTQLPVFAAIAALLVVQPSVNQSVGKALERSVGVIAGVLLAYGIGVLFDANSWVVLFGIVLAIFLGWALRLTPSSAAQIPISVMLVLSIGAATPDYALVRIIETLIGAAIGVAITLLLVPPVHLEPARETISALGREVAASFDRLADALRQPASPAQLEEMMITARLLRPMQMKAEEALETAEESLALNPRAARWREEFDRDAELFARLRPLVTRTLGMTRAVRDHYDVSLIVEPTVQAITAELDRAAHDLRLLLVRGEQAVPTRTAEVPLLTAPLRIPRPNPQHWVLIGSLTEDLRRVHEEIVGTA